jgi:hypothetical protein
MHFKLQTWTLHKKRRYKKRRFCFEHQAFMLFCELPYPLALNQIMQLMAELVLVRLRKQDPLG